MAVMGDYSLLRVLHPFYPNHQEIDDARLAFRGNLSSFGNLPPFFKTASAASCRCVLSLEDGMSAHGSLSSVVRRIRRCKACADEVGGMAPYRRHAFIRNILSVCRRKPEPRSELRPCKLRERFINSHLPPRNHQPFLMTCLIISFIFLRICVRECVLSPNYAKTQNGLYFYLRSDIICGVKKRLCIHLKLDSNIMDIKRDFYLELLG